MPSTTYFPFSTPAIGAVWLNEVNDAVFNAIGNGTAAPTTPAEVLANIGAAALSDLADGTDAAKGAGMVGYSATTGYTAGTVGEKLNQFRSAKDNGATGDGVADDTSEVSAAVAAAYAAGDWLFWPDGTYLTTASIANFHDVKHWGPGVVKRGSTLFYITPTENQTNNVYADVSTGVDTNDGLSSGEPIQTLQASIDAVEGFRHALNNGTWKINLAAGTYARGRFPDEGLPSLNPIYIVGPSVGGHPNVPTALVKEGATEAAFGLRVANRTDVHVQDVKFEDYNGSTSSAGISASNRCNVFTTNCHFEDCYIGVSGTEWCELDTKGGVFNDCGYLNSTTAGGYGIRGLFHGKFSIGTQGAGDLTQGPNFTNNYFAVFGQESCTGHVDWCTFSGNNAGVRLTINSRANCGGSSFTSNGVAIWTTDGSIASANSDTTFTTNTQNIIVGNACTSSASQVLTDWSPSYGRTEYVVWGSKASQTVTSTSATVIQTATIAAGMLRETYSSLVPPKKLGFRVFGSLTGTNDFKRIQVRLGASPASITFTAAETGNFVATAEVVLRAPDSQIARVEGFRNGGSGSRTTVSAFTEALTAATAFNVEALVGNASDSIVIEYAEIYLCGV